MINRWRLLADDGVRAADGLALDEALLASQARDAHALTPPTLRLYTYASHCALVGRYQHLEAEVDLAACSRTGTDVSRRPTGGGAIVMGEGQLGVAVATTAPAGESPRALLARYAEGIAAGLAALGVPVRFRGKNDLETNGRKIAGLGLYLDGRGGLLFHASVLAELDVAFMLSVLRIPAAKLGDKAIAAVEERVTTVSRETGRPQKGSELRDAVAAGFAEVLGVELEPGEPTAVERQRAERLQTDRYANDAWLFERTPQSDATATSVFKTPEGLVRCYLSLHGPTIKSALFAGDFNEVPEPLARFEGDLRWSRLDEAELIRLADRVFADGTGLGVEPAVVVGAVLDAGRRTVASSGAAPVRPQGSCYFPEVS